MYVIIGGDGNEYGPVSGADLRQWVSEDRLNARSLVKAEGDAEFRPLSTFPEFAGLFEIAGRVSKTPPTLGAVGAGSREMALQRIKVPAVALMAASILNIILALWALDKMIFSSPDPQLMKQINLALEQLDNPQIEQFVQKMLHLMNGPLDIVNILVELAVSVLILAGAKKMKSLQSYQFSLAAAGLSTVPCMTPCAGFFLGLAFGIWALVVLRRPDVKSHFS